MVDFECGKIDRPGCNSLAFFAYRFTGSHDKYAASVPVMEKYVACEPGKTYGDSGKREAGKTSAPGEDIFTRLDRLREQAHGSSVKGQLERLQAIAELMQAPDQGPLPGEMLRVYAWEVEDAAKLLMELWTSEE